MLLRLNLLLLLGSRESQVTRMWRMDPPEESRRKPCPCLVSMNAKSSNSVLSWCNAFSPTSWSIKWGDSRDQLECIDPRLAARMVNQLKCLRMRKFSSSKFCQLRVQSPKLPLTACSSKSRKKVGGIHHFSTCQFLHSRFSTLTCFHLRDFEVSAREQFSHFYF